MEFLQEVAAWFADPANWTGRYGIPYRTLEHLRLTVIPTVIAATIALPPALWLAHRRRFAFLATTVVNLGRALPSFGILVVAAVVLIGAGLGGQFWPIVIALVVLGLPPMFTNAYAGIEGVDPGAVEAARGTGYTEAGVLLRVEVPMAAPVIIAGLRIAFIQILATVPLAALIGSGGGLGRYVIDGFALGAVGRVRAFAGALLIALLTLAAEAAIDALERALVPAGVRTTVRRTSVAEAGAA